MIEAHTDANIAFGGELRQAEQLIDVSCRGFLDEHVDSGADGGPRNLDLRVLRRGNDDCVNIAESSNSRQSLPATQPSLKDATWRARGKSVSTQWTRRAPARC